MARRSPDVLLVVLDCVRADTFPGLDDDRVVAPFLRGLLGRSLLFTGATSVAPWTRPAHASLFTGRYPWEHGCHTKGLPYLAASWPHIAVELRSAGYHAIGASANPQISSDSGLGRGFDRLAWGRWGERASLRPPSERPPHEATRPELGRPGLHTGRSRWGRVRYLESVLQHRYLGVSDLGLRALARIHGRSGGIGDIAEWVEPTLEKYLEVAPASAPLFGFVNLMDAHEPYFATNGDADGLGSMWRYYRVPQDHFGYIVGRTAVDPARLAPLRSAYLRQISRLDARVRRIVGSWEEVRGARPWLIVTSDHGQAFGERGALFHSVVPDETHLRIPLLIAPPSADAGAGGVMPGRVSLLDLYATIRGIAKLPPDPSSSARDLLATPPLGRTVLASSDGIASGFPFDRFIEPSRLAELDRVYGIAYHGDWKVWHDATSGSQVVYHLVEDPLERSPQDPASAGVPLQVREAAARAGSSMLAPTPDGALQARLAGWGYYQ